MHQVIIGNFLVATPQQDGGLGGAISNIVKGALQEARVELQAQVAGLEAQRAQLEVQLQNAGSRAERQRIQSRIDRLDVQIREMNDGIAKLETGVAGQPAPAPAPRVTVTPSVGVPPRLPNIPSRPFDPTELVATSLGILFVAFPLTLAIVRFIWKRSTSAPTPAISAEQIQRFDRLEQSVDAIAIEVERISENQRYLTKVLGESKSSAKIGA